MNILSIGADAKTVKGEKSGFLTAIAYLSSGTNKGVNLCPHATKECLALCLGKIAGRMRMSTVQRAQKERADLFIENQKLFMETLETEIKKFLKRAEKRKLIPVIRLNGSTDIDYQDIKLNGKNIFQMFPKIQFYDYTKDFKKLVNSPMKTPNYHLTFSHSGGNMEECQGAIDLGFNVAYVYSKDSWISKLFEKKLPEKYIDGDLHDLRFLDGKGKLILLKAKGTGAKNAFIQ